MRRFAALTGLVFLCTFLAHSAIAATPPVSAATPSETSPPITPSLVIAPHRAIYAMSLASSKNGSTVTDVAGHMLFEWRDVCDGWAIQQHMQLHFVYSEGDEQDIASTELTWESKDGKKFNFNIHHMTNGKETDVFRGKGVVNDDGTTTVNYILPEVKTLTLPAGTLFPSAHTALILQKAAQGEKMFTRQVFDGSDEDGSSDISAFILPPKAVTLETSLSKKVKDSPLLAPPAWPVRMAFYKIGSQTSEPDYEMDLDLLPNGIARHMRIDYGDFAVTGNLDELEPLPAPSCS